MKVFYQFFLLLSFGWKTATVLGQESTLTDVIFEQYDWYFEDEDGNFLLAEVNSDIGSMTWTYMPHPNETLFLNVNISLPVPTQSPTGWSWAVMNLPLASFADIEQKDVTSNGETTSTWLSFAELGVPSGVSIDQIMYSVTTTLEEQTSGPGPTSIIVPVVPYEWFPTIGYSVGTPGAEDPGHESQPKPPPPTRTIANENAKKKKPTHKKRSFQHVEEDVGFCVAGSFARSLRWLDETCPDDLFKGDDGPLTSQQIYQELVNAGVSVVDDRTKNRSQLQADWIEKKNSYAIADGRRIKTEIFETKEGEVAKTPNVKRTVDKEIGPWILAEMDKGCDVEIGYTWSRGPKDEGAHMVTASQVIATEHPDQFVLTYQDDNRQNVADGKERVRTEKLYKHKADGSYRLHWDHRMMSHAVSECVQKNTTASPAPSISREPSPTPSPTISPTKPDDKPVASWGEPHFKGWNGNRFDYHGECDLVLLRSEGFGDGLGLHIHIRTKIRFGYSFITSAALRIGDDVFEVVSRGGRRLNGEKVFRESLVSVSDFAIEHTRPNQFHHVNTLDLKEEGLILIKTYKDFVSVEIVSASINSFGESVGLMGNFYTGEKLARNGTELIDPNDFGQEWQVRDDEMRLFHDVERAPQYPEQCLLPAAAMAEGRRRLMSASMISHAEAEEACAGWNEDVIEDCIFDVMATGDLEMANQDVF